MLDNMGFDAFNEEDSETRFRLNAEWVTIIALRDMANIAHKAQNTSYNQTLVLAQELSPQLFDPNVSLLNKGELSPRTKKYIQESKLQSKVGGNEVLAEDIAKQERDRYQEHLNKTELLGSRDLEYVVKEINDIDKSLYELQKRKHSENALIFRDALQSHREYPVSGSGKNYKEYKISPHRALRVRILHPDKAEHAIGGGMHYHCQMVGLIYGCANAFFA